MTSTKGKNQTESNPMNEQKNLSNFLSPAQAKVLSHSLCVGCLFFLLGLGVWTVQLLGELMSYFSAVIWPLAIASILAILLHPLVQIIRKNFGLGLSSSILLIYFLGFCSCTLLVWGIGGEVIRQYKEFTNASINWPETIEGKIKESVNPETWSAMANKFSQFKDQWKEVIGNLAKEVPEFSQGSAKALQGAWAGIHSIFSLLACLAIVPIYLFYFLSSRRDYISDLADQLSFINSGMRQDLIYLIRQFKEILEGFFRGQLIIGLMMGIGYAVGFSFSGLKFGIALGVFFGVLNIVPFLGSILGVISVIAVSYLQPGGILESGQWNVFLGCGITFAVVQLLESYWLSPKVMGQRTGLHPMVIIASVFFWGTAFDGVLGMILGIPLTAFIIVFWRLLRKKYLTP